MSNAIDLTAEADSPPRVIPPPLALPVGRGVPGPSRNTSSSATPASSSFLDNVLSVPTVRGNASSTSGGGAGPSTSTLASPADDVAMLRVRTGPRVPTSSDIREVSANPSRTRDRAGRRGPRSTPSNSSSGPSTTSMPATAQRRLMVRDVTDDGFELTGMSEGARQAAERARREAEESQRWRQDFLLTNSRIIPGGIGQANGGIRVHDSLPPGPHRALPTEGQNPLASLSQEARDLVGDLFDLSDGRGLSLQTLTALLRGDPAVATRGGTTGRGGTAGRGRGGHHNRIPAVLNTIVPSKHDFKMVTNHRSRTVRTGFSFGIIEPPVDVETFDQDPNLIRGDLPDTSPICAGCDCALVLQGNDAKRMWALPCGHVIDGRCYDRYCHGISAKTARELAHAEVEAEQSKMRQAKITEMLHGTKRPRPGEGGKDEEGLYPGGASSNKRPKYEGDVSDFKGKDRAVSPDASSDTEPESEGPSQSRRLRRRDDGSLAVAVASNGPGQRDDTLAAANDSSPSTQRRKVTSFTCPVEDCTQKVMTGSGKPTSAIALFI